MRCSITGAYIIATIVAFTLLSVSGEQVLQECQLGYTDEVTLLQAAATAKSTAGMKGDAEAPPAKRRTPICIEPEESLEFHAVDDPKPLASPLIISFKSLESFEPPKAAPAPVLFFVLRALLWVISFGVAAGIVMRWLPCTVECATEAAAHTKHEADPMVIASQRALHEAALSGDDMRCQSLLDMAVLTSGARPPDVIAAADPWGNTALHAAAMSGAGAVVELFLEHDTPLDLRDAWDETPLHLASRGGHVEICELLVARGASLRVVNAEDMTPLVVAAHAGQEAACARLLEMGAGAEGLPEEELPDMLHELMIANLMARAMAGSTSSAAS